MYVLRKRKCIRISIHFILALSLLPQCAAVCVLPAFDFLLCSLCVYVVQKSRNEIFRSSFFFLRRFGVSIYLWAITSALYSRPLHARTSYTYTVNTHSSIPCTRSYTVPVPAYRNTYMKLWVCIGSEYTGAVEFVMCLSCTHTGTRSNQLRRRQVRKTRSYNRIQANSSASHYTARSAHLYTCMERHSHTHTHKLVHGRT